MKYLNLFLVTFIFCIPLFSQTTYKYYNGKKYTFKLTKELIKKTKIWDSQKDKNPPLDASKALKISNDFIKTIKLLEDEPFNHSAYFRGLTLVRHHDNYWYWEANWDINGPILGGVPYTMTCIILMDGSIIKPMITDIEKDKKEP